MPFVVSFPAVFAETVINLDQSCADEKERYYIEENTIFQLTEDVIFDGYEKSGIGSTYNGNVFYHIDEHVFLLSTIQGDKNKSFNVTFSNSSAEWNGISETSSIYGNAGSLPKHTFKNLNSLQILDNSLKSTFTSPASNSTLSFGGGISASYFILDNVDELIVRGNTISGTTNMMGGGIHTSRLRTGSMIHFDGEYPNNDIFEGGTGNITIEGNSCLAEKTGLKLYGGGVGNLEGSSQFADRWENTGAISFINNSISYNTKASIDTSDKGEGLFRGGGYYSGSAGYFINNSNIRFIGNSVDASAADNKAIARGGGIHGITLQFKQVTSSDEAKPALYFANNKALGNSHIDSLGDGGAIYAAILYITESEDTLFENNYASDRGGAIYIRNVGGNGYKSLLSADYGNITFKGNTDSLGNSFERNTGIANAIHFEDTGGAPFTLLLQAKEGYSVNFYDRITSDTWDSEQLLIGINSETHNGTVRFSGKHVTETLAGSEGTADYADRVQQSKKSDVNAAFYMYGGALVIEEGATLGRKFHEGTFGSGAEFLFEAGILDISGTIENGNSTLASNTIMLASADATLRIGHQAFFDANTVEIENGVSIDLAYHFSQGSIIANDGLIVTAETFKLDGDIVILDMNANFYRDEIWSENLEFILFDICNVNNMLEGDNINIKSQLTGGSEVNDPALYSGYWEMSVTSDQVIAKWINTGSPIPEPLSSSAALIGLFAMLMKRKRTTS